VLKGIYIGNKIPWQTGSVFEPQTVVMSCMYL